MLLEEEAESPFEADDEGKSSNKQDLRAKKKKINIRTLSSHKMQSRPIIQFTYISNSQECFVKE